MLSLKSKSIYRDDFMIMKGQQKFLVMMMREPSHQEIVGQSRSSQASGINEVTGEQTV